MQLEFPGALERLDRQQDREPRHGLNHPFGLGREPEDLGDAGRVVGFAAFVVGVAVRDKEQEGEHRESGRGRRDQPALAPGSADLLAGAVGLDAVPGGGLLGNPAVGLLPLLEPLELLSHAPLLLPLLAPPALVGLVGLPPGLAGVEEPHRQRKVATVTLGPAVGRADPFFPGQCQVEVGDSPEPGLIRLPALRPAGEAGVGLRRGRLVVAPAAETVPLAKKALVADVHPGFRPDGGRQRGGEETEVGVAKGVDNPRNLADVRPRDARDGLYRRRAADFRPRRVPLGEQTEEGLGDPTVFRVEGEVGGVGVARQRAVDSPHRLVVGEREHDALAGPGRSRGGLPEPHQDVLHQRELVVPCAGVIEQSGGQPRLDLAVEDPSGSFDHLPALVAGQPWGQELALVERLGEPLEAAALAKVVRPHCHRDVDRRRLLPRGLQDQGDERVGLTPVAPAGIAEDLLELVHQQQEPAAAGERGLGQDVRQGPRPAPSAE